jgi:hypothetical protein
VLTTGSRLWRTVPYVSPSGASEVVDYLRDLRDGNRKSWEFFENIRSQIVERGPFIVGPPYWEGVGGELFEVSWGRHRVYCSVEEPRLVVMYCAVYKLWPKFRSADRRKCETRRSDFRSGEYDEESRSYLYEMHRQKRDNRGKDGPT